MFGRKNKISKACQADTTQEDEILDLTSYSDVIMSDKLLDDIISQIQIRKDLKSMQSDKSSTGPKTFNPKKPGAKLPDKFLVDGVMYQKGESKSNEEPGLSAAQEGLIKFQDNLRSMLDADMPHIRIEFDDITDTPKVFIDGVEKGNVQHINLAWYKPDMEDEYARGRYRIEMVDKQRRLHGIGQGK
ncbi:hypothetical protein [Lactiplantibacillus plantarum]|uniref:hypothetical protein n=1 Tax=Lactiplantibacillus plantarum TaxID=1590 RepID=UPI0018AD4061|nr:hypothetical protein [Lactiplantibacillus plantarum]WGF83434.1 hypothetical protein QB909_09045 [Lactiplantibacillus plantarum]WGG40759.1 hypothetical protein QCL57_09045 [Lactiplantibacillus plantarum]